MKLKFFELAKKIRLHSDHTQHHIGAVIVKKNKVISLGFNKLKTSPRSPHPYGSIHAEVSALLKASPDDCKGASIYVYRERRDGCLGNSRPCSYCYSALKEAGIKNLYYSKEDGYTEEKI